MPSDRNLTTTLMDDETHITLGLLNAIHENSAVTQRSVAKDLGVALGLANAYLKRCVKKGLVKVQQAPANRYAYYLTPQGFAEKSRLTARYLAMSFDFYRHARTQCADVFDECLRHGWRRVALAGVGDLGEIATLCIRDRAIDLVGFIEPKAPEGETFSGLPVVARIQDLGPVEALVVTDLVSAQETFDRLASQFPPQRVLAPRLLNIVRRHGE